MDVNQFIQDAAQAAKGDYAQAFKLLGFVVYVAEAGGDQLLTGDLISRQTYFRWMEIVKRAGWGDLLADARLRQALQEYLWQRFEGLPIETARAKVLTAVKDAIAQTTQPNRTPKITANRCAASEEVKGGRSPAEGRSTPLTDERSAAGFEDRRRTVREVI
ncbi:MAG: hypothetical protein JXA97_09370 [Anaerolineales bacterium]|nr:hypothetical protein [Anaerolineales bacterium]